MSLTLAQYEARVLDLLDDVTGLRFTDLQVDAALRTALMFYNRLRPLQRTYQVDTTGAQVITLPTDFVASMITRVQIDIVNPTQMIILPDVMYKASRLDEQWVIETTNAIYPLGQVLVVSYVGSHTVDGLDGGAGTTIDNDDLLVLGAAGHACQSRAISRAESINMQPGVQSQLLASAQNYLSLFYNGLRSNTGVVGIAF